MKKKFAAVYALSNVALREASFDLLAYTKERLDKPEWAVRGPRGGRWIASGPVRFDTSDQVNGSWERNETVLRAVRNEGRYIRPRDKAAVQHWEELGGL